MGNLVLNAKRLAEYLHRDHRRKYTDEPYTVHLAEVARLVREADLGEEAEAAAWLHDSIEDVGATEALIIKELGGTPAAKRVAALVVWLTDEEALDPSIKALKRPVRKELRRANLKHAPYLVKSIKCADTISNTSNIAEHDTGFAKTYLPEINKLLSSLVGAHSGLWKKAANSFSVAVAKMDEKGIKVDLA